MYYEKGTKIGDRTMFLFVIWIGLLRMNFVFYKK